MSKQVRAGQIRQASPSQSIVVIESQRGRSGEEGTMIVIGVLSEDGTKVIPAETRCRSTVAKWPVVGKVKLSPKRRPGHAVAVVAE